MKNLFLTCILLISHSAQAFSQEFKIGDRVVAIEEIQIMEDGQPVGNVSRGFPLDVITVEGDRLRVKSPRPGWISASQVISQTDALKYFSELINNDPTNRDDLYARAMVWLSIDKYDEAIADFTKRIAIKAEYRDYNERGYCWMMKGDMDKAIADFNTAVELAPKDARMRLNRGLAYKKSGDIERATQDFNDALELDSELIGAYENRGLIHLRNNDLVNAVRDFDAVISLNPQSVRIRELRGRCLIDLGKAADAIIDFTKILERDPQSVNALFYRGNAYESMGQYENALLDYNHVLKILPRNAIVYFRRGKTYHATDNLETALQDLNKALSIDADNVYFLRERADIYKDKEQYQKAVADLNRLLKQIPNSVPDLISRASSLKMLDQSAEAIHDLSLALKVDPGHDLAPLAHYIRGDLRRVAGDFESAIVDYDHALLGARSPEILYLRSKCYRNLGKPEQAIAGLRESIAINPDYIQALNGLAWILATWPSEEIRDGEHAVVHARHACELSDWKDPLLLDTLAAAYAESGDFQSARNYLDAAIQLMDDEIQVKSEVVRKQKLYKANKPYRESIPALDSEKR